MLVSDYFTMGFAMDALPKKIAFLPKGAWILDVLINVTEAFNGGTTDYVIVGITSGGAELFAQASCVGPGILVASQATSPLVPYARLTADTYIYAQYDDASSDATTGIMEIAVVWAPGFEKDV